MDDELRDQAKRLADRAEINDCMQRYVRDASYDRPLAASRMAANIIDQISAQP